MAAPVTYESLITAGAQHVIDALRRSGGQRVRVWALPPDRGEPGCIVAGYSDPPPHAAEIAPAGGGSWNVVPYSAVASRLWHACRSVPLFPEVR